MCRLRVEFQGLRESFEEMGYIRTPCYIQVFKNQHHADIS